MKAKQPRSNITELTAIYSSDRVGAAVDANYIKDIAREIGWRAEGVRYLATAIISELTPEKVDLDKIAQMLSAIRQHRCWDLTDCIPKLVYWRDYHVAMI